MAVTCTTPSTLGPKFLFGARPLQCFVRMCSDGAWTPYPEAVDKLFTEETERKAELYLGPLRVDPWLGVQNVDIAKPMVGGDSKLSPREMRAAFRWTPGSILVGSTKDRASILVGS